jgi:hypothetical protein
MMMRMRIVMMIVMMMKEIIVMMMFFNEFTFRRSLCIAMGVTPPLKKIKRGLIFFIIEAKKRILHYY